MLQEQSLLLLHVERAHDQAMVFLANMLWGRAQISLYLDPEDPGHALRHAYGIAAMQGATAIGIPARVRKEGEIEDYINGNITLEMVLSEEQGHAIKIDSREFGDRMREAGISTVWYKLGTVEVVEIDIKAARDEASSKGWDTMGTFVGFPPGQPPVIRRGAESGIQPIVIDVSVSFTPKRRGLSWWLVFALAALIVLLGVLTSAYMPSAMAVTLLLSWKLQGWPRRIMLALCAGLVGYWLSHH